MTKYYTCRVRSVGELKAAIADIPDCTPVTQVNPVNCEGDCILYVEGTEGNQRVVIYEG